MLFDCKGRTDVYVKDVNLKYKIKPVKDGHLIEEEIQSVGNAGSMQGGAGQAVSEEIQSVGNADRAVSESIQNIEGYRI